MSRFAILFIMFLSFTAYAETNSFHGSYENGKTLAGEMQTKVLSSLQQFRPESVFNDFTKHPQEADSYGGVQQKEDPLKTKASHESATNPIAKTLSDNFSNRPQYKVDANTESMKNAQWLIDHAHDVTRGKSCKKIPVCETTYENNTCQEEASIRWYFCQKRLQVTVENQVHETHYPVTIHLKSDRYYMGARLDAITGRLIDHGPHDARASMDGRLPANIDCKTLQSTIIKTTMDRRFIDGISFPACGNLDINIHLTDSNKRNRINGSVTIDIVSRRVDSTINDVWDDGCLKFAGDNQCKLEVEQCTQSNETQIIGGVPITRDCWATHLKYSCQAHDNIPYTCTPLRQKGCEQIGSICHTKQADQCVLYDQTFRCPLKSCALEEQTICTDEPACINGNCSIHEKVNDPDFNQAVGSFGAMVDAAKQMNKNNRFIFHGQEASCSKAPIGFMDCCADSGWGQDLYEKCSEQEKKLKKDKENHLAVAINGDYCAHEVGGICTSTRKRYCVFTTKLARLIQDKGRREQLHISFGTPNDPNCIGISPEELQRIDFSKIDFSEIADDIKKSMPSRDQDALIKKLNQRIQEMGQKNV